MPKTELNHYGCETFMGLEITPDGKTQFVALNLHGGSSAYYTSLEMACRILCAEVKYRNKVLLFKSPGKSDEKQMGLEGVRDILANSAGRAEDLEKQILNLRANQNTVSGTYLPFKPEQMQTLERMYESKTEMKKYPNPFLNQPE